MRTLLLPAAVLLVAVALYLWLDRRGSGRNVPERTAPEAGRQRKVRGTGEEAAAVPRTVLVEREAGGVDVLQLEVVDGTGSPFATGVVLWRLGADQDERAGKWRAPFTTELAEGTYRAVCFGARGDVADPPPFLVRGRTRVRLVAPRPRDGDVLLRVRHADGRAVKRGRLFGGGIERVAGEPKPPWLRHVGPPARSESAWKPDGDEAIVNDAGAGFRVGRVPGNARSASFARRARFTIPGHSAVRVRAGGDAQGPQTLVAVVVRLQTLLNLVRVPAGVDPSAIEIEAYCFAERDTPWDRVPVSVGVDVPGYRHLRFEYVVANPPRERFDPPTEPTRPAK